MHGAVLFKHFVTVLAIKSPKNVKKIRVIIFIPFGVQNHGLVYCKYPVRYEAPNPFLDIPWFLGVQKGDDELCGNTAPYQMMLGCGCTEDPNYQYIGPILMRLGPPRDRNGRNASCH